MRPLVHRGIDIVGGETPVEGSWEILSAHLRKGRGLEFDIQVTRDGHLAVLHDADLKRLTDGRSTQKLKDMTLHEVQATPIIGGRIGTLEELLEEIRRTDSGVSALHLKAHTQTREVLELLIQVLSRFEDLFPRLIVFDVKLETAEFLKAKLPTIQLAPSVAHEFDIARYNASVGGTLWSLDAALARRDLFQWLWLDEWDLRDEAGGQKVLYNATIFQMARERGYKTVVISPELHATSPALLGGESHEDGRDRDKLWRRLREIANYRPDLLCTDFTSALTLDGTFEV